MGATLSSLSAVSTDENWIEKFIAGNVKVIHKKLELSSLAVYFNTDATMLSGTFESQEEFLAAFKAKASNESLVDLGSCLTSYTLARLQPTSPCRIISTFCDP